MSEMNETDWKLAYAICKAESDDTPCACEQEEEFPCRVYSKGAEIACRLVTAELAATPMADEDALVEAMGQAIQDEMRPSDGWIESEAARFAKDMSRAALSAIRSHLAALQARAEAAEAENRRLQEAAEALGWMIAIHDRSDQHGGGYDDATSLAVARERFAALGDKS